MADASRPGQLPGDGVTFASILRRRTGGDNSATAALRICSHPTTRDRAHLDKGAQVSENGVIGPISATRESKRRAPRHEVQRPEPKRPEGAVGRAPRALVGVAWHGKVRAAHARGGSLHFLPEQHLGSPLLRPGAPYAGRPAHVPAGGTDGRELVTATVPWKKRSGQ